eukprot:TRINITY_DN1632_c0_g1_i4.p1 TRINITY_DN1632_c0_g1~~TRINITY_DN1632_c0_g1_i4.p1  ORF type:complete len:345 (+),score=51.98 TRINITY_DN1632_c0_g1_i4:151-1185(+)
MVVETRRAKAARDDAAKADSQVATAVLVFSIMATRGLLPQEAWSLSKGIAAEVNPPIRLVLMEGKGVPERTLDFGSIIEVEILGDFGDQLLTLPSKVPSWNAKLATLQLYRFSGQLPPLPANISRLDLTWEDDLLVEVLNLPLLATSPPEEGTVSLPFTSDADAANFCQQLSQLQHLHTLELWYPLTQVPESLMQLCRLRKLNLGWICASHLPGMEGLQSLTELEIHECELVDLPISIGALRNLTTLEIHRCHELISLPNSIGELAALTHIVIDVCKITTLPDSVGDLQRLSALLIADCKDLVTLPESIARLTTLQVEVGWCPKLKLTALPDAITQMQGFSMHA